MKKIVFVVGGARSGKSTHAVHLAEKSRQKVIFLATCTWRDKEIEQRIKLHQASRPVSWEVIMEGKNIAQTIERVQGAKTTILIDCLAMWIFNLMETHSKNGPIEAEFEKFIQTLPRIKGFVIIVSNEVGCGVVPAYKSGRRFRDLIGRLNQMVARIAQEVILMQIGIPTKLTSS